MKSREFRNDVMYDAFLNMDVGDNLHTPFVKACVRSLRRFKPSEFGGFRVQRKERERGERRRKGGVS